MYQGTGNFERQTSTSNRGGLRRHSGRPPHIPGASHVYHGVRAHSAAAAAPLVTPDDPAGRVARLFDAHHDRLYRLARRLTHSADDACDLVQDVFLRAARDPGRVPAGPSPEEAWLVRVLVNLQRDRLPPRRRAVIVLHELEGASLERIASLLGISAITARWHLARGRRDLETLLRTQRGETR